MKWLSWIPGVQWARVGMALALLSAIVGVVLAYGHHQYTKAETITTTKYQLALSKLSGEAAQKLAAAIEQVRNAEKALGAAKNLQELKDAENQKINVDLTRRLRDSAGPAGRLRDPNAGQCRGSGSNPPDHAASAARPGADDGAEAGGLFSKEASGLLLELTEEADAINNAYASCRKDSGTIRGQP